MRSNTASRFLGFIATAQRVKRLLRWLYRGYSMMGLNLQQILGVVWSDRLDVEANEFLHTRRGDWTSAPICNRAMTDMNAAVIQSLSVERGAYALVIDLARPLALEISRYAGSVLPAGRYVYCGSAYGPGGIRARVSRHCRTDKKLRWHVDHLTRTGTVVVSCRCPEGGNVPCWRPYWRHPARMCRCLVSGVWIARPVRRISRPLVRHSPRAI